MDSEAKKCGEMEFSFSLFLGGSDMLRRLKMHSGGEREGGGRKNVMVVGGGGKKKVEIGKCTKKKEKACKYRRHKERVET